MAELAFDDPPPKPGTWRERLAPLTEHPGRWVDLTETYGIRPKRNTTNKLNAREVAVPPGEWSFASRGINSTNPRLYARYDGESTGG